VSSEESERLALVRSLQRAQSSHEQWEARAAANAWLQMHPGDDVIRKAVARVDASIRWRLEELLAALDTAGQPYRLLPPAEEKAWYAWYNQHFPSYSSGWSDAAPIRDRHCYRYEPQDGQYFNAHRAFHQLCDEFALDNPAVVVLWPGYPPTPLELTLNGIREHLDLVWGVETVSFIVDTAGEWSICLNFDRQVCFGRPVDSPA
jgi:hypothetical protein